MLLCWYSLQASYAGHTVTCPDRWLVMPVIFGILGNSNSVWASTVSGSGRFLGLWRSLYRQALKAWTQAFKSNQIKYSVISYRINFGWIFNWPFLIRFNFAGGKKCFFRFWLKFRWSFLNMNWGHERLSRTDGFCVGIQTRSFY